MTSEAPDTPPLLRVVGLEIGYGEAESAIRGVSFHVDSGELVSFVGANGAGKTTLMTGVAGLLSLRGGVVYLRGADVTNVPGHRRAGMGLALALEGHEIVAELSVEDNLQLTLFGAWPRVSSRLKRERTAQAYQMFPVLYDRRQQLAGTLSGGQQQMLAIGRLLSAKADVLLLDEPSLGLAPAVAEDVYIHLGQLRSQGKAVVVVEQNAMLAGSVSDRTYLLRLGSVVGETDGMLTRDQLREAYL